MTQSRWRQRLLDLQEASARLSEAVEAPEHSSLERDGVIQRFEFSFELAWKTLKDYLEDQGFTEVSSPKKALREAFQQNLLADGQVWMDMLEDRNRMSHLYDQAASEEIFRHIRDKYAAAIKGLAGRFKD